ncbi:MAG: Eco57I restriction-modification methylase domain-containing protein [Candidatus Xenobiia bacterium LiM19]
MEALEPGKPLSFLEHHIQCGNSLLGAIPRLLKGGIPDEAFTPIEGDDRNYCKALKKKNREERSGQMDLFSARTEGMTQITDLSHEMADLDAIQDDTMEDIHRKEKEYETLLKSAGFFNSRLLADSRCAAFVWKKLPGSLQAITEDVFHTIESRPHEIPMELVEAIWKLSEQYRFFHWHIAFPEVFRVPGKGEKAENELAGWSGGFDVVLGNPPWKRIKLQEQEWFETREPEISKARNLAERKLMIDRLKKEGAFIYNEYLSQKRLYDGETNYYRNSCFYPLCGRRDLNTFSLFAELMRILLSEKGNLGAIMPTSIATDDTTKCFFEDLVKSNELESLYDFNNKENLFPEVKGHQQFCLLTLSKRERNRPRTPKFSFFLENTNKLDGESVFEISYEDICLVNPNTKTTPVFRTKKDADLVKSIYLKHPVIINENDKNGNVWAIRFMRMFDMANDSGLFISNTQVVIETEKDKLVPLFDPKMAQQYNHRAANLGHSGHQFRKISKDQSSFEDFINPFFTPTPAYWVKINEVDRKLIEWKSKWLFGFKDITGTTSTYLSAFTIIPRLAVDHTFSLVFSDKNVIGHALLLANMNSLIIEYILRLKLQGLHLTYFILKQLPVLPPETYDQPCQWCRSEALSVWILPRVLELTYTTWDLEPFAKDCGYGGPPFKWDEERRFLMRCELDAAYFHLYGIERDDVDYIMETFPIVKRKDIANYSEYRTKRVILEMYDRMKEAMTSGKPYETLLDPSPADSRVAHPPREQIATLKGV